MDATDTKISHRDVRLAHNGHAGCTGGWNCPWDRGGKNTRSNRILAARGIRHANRVALRVAVRDGVEG